MSPQIKKLALLIGIDCYQPDPSKQETKRLNIRKNKIVYRDLKGAVNDIVAVNRFLTNTMGVEQNNITMLLAPAPGGDYPLGLPEGGYTEPTYENIIRALVDLAKKVEKTEKADQAEAGSLVYIHYSGHGGVATTLFSHLKGEGAEDEAIVPSDITCGGKYLRDVEIGALLQDIIDKTGVILTVVLDSCYSGGALRDDYDDDDDDGEDTAEDIRGVKSLYQSDPTLDLPMDKHSLESTKRHGNLDWMRAPKGFVVLAACQDYQKAKEMTIYRDGPVRSHGVLTHWLLDTIRTSPLHLSSDAVYNRVCTKIGNSVKDQTPHIIGERDRFFFNSEFRPRVYTLQVIRTQRESATGDSLVLGGGLVDCVRTNSVYSILPMHFDMRQPITQNSILAQVKIKTVQVGDSITYSLEKNKTPRWQEIQAGCLAVLYSLPIECQSTVKFGPTDDKKLLLDLHKEFDQACTDGGSAWLRRVNDHADFDVKVAEDGNFEVNDRAGLFTTQTAKHLEPIEWDARKGNDGMSRLVTRLSHLARFKLIKGLDNPGFRDSSLVNLISVDVSPAPSGRNLPGGEWCQPVKELNIVDGIYRVPPKQWFRISIRNDTEMTVGCVIFNLTVDFEIAKTFPPYEAYKNIAPKTKLEDDFIETIPEHLQHLAEENIPFVETFKVVVTAPPKDLDSLVMDSLQDVEDSMRGDETEPEGQPNNLDGLLQELAPLTRKGYCASTGSIEGNWITFDVRVQVDPLE
jgi:hypothetical protein